MLIQASLADLMGISGKKGIGWSSTMFFPSTLPHLKGCYIWTQGGNLG
jgi:hypothetical protein